MSGYSGVVNSQDTYAAPGVALTVVGTGGGAGSNVPANIVVSTISALGVLNVSSINGNAYVAPTANPNFSTISTFAISGLSSINGAPYATVPANFTNNSISTNAIITSSINSFLLDDIPYTYTQPNGLVDKTISSIYNTSAPGDNAIQSYIDCGAPLAGHISTMAGRTYTVAGVMKLSPVGGSWPSGAASPNAFMSIWGGGATGYINSTYWSYPQISTAAGLIGDAPNNTPTLQWIAPGSFTPVNLDQSGAPGNSTIQYYAYVSGGWPIAVNVQVSSLVGNIVTQGTNLVRITDNGPIYLGDN